MPGRGLAVQKIPSLEIRERTVFHGRLSELINSFANDNPTIEWQFQEILSSNPIDQLKAGVIDLAVFYGFCSDPYLRGTTVEKETCLIAIPARNPLARSKENIGLDKLEGQRLLVPAQRTSFGLYENLIAACSDVAAHTTSRHWRLPNLRACERLLLEERCQRSLALPHKGIVYRPLPGDDIEIALRLYWRKAELPRAGRKFREIRKAKNGPERLERVSKIGSASHQVLMCEAG